MPTTPPLTDFQKFEGFSLGFVAIFFWSFNVIYAHYLSSDLTPVQIAFFRWLIAILIFLPFSYKTIIKNYSLLLKNWVLILEMAVFGIALSNTFVYIAAHSASAIDMALIGTTGPIFLIFFSRVFLNIHIKPKQILGIISSLIGVLIIITDGKLLQLEQFKLVDGDFWMLMTAITFGFYGTLQAKRPKDLDALALLPATIFVAVIILLPFFIYSLYNSPIVHLSYHSAGLVVYLAIFNSVIAYFCWNSALFTLGSLKTSIIYYLMPVLSTIEAYFLLGEKIYTAQLYGGLLVLSGIIFSNWHHRTPPPERA